MSLAELGALLGDLPPRAAFCMLACARLLPVAWLCPLFGGRVTPPPVRLGIGLALSLLLGRAGVAAPIGATLAALVPACLREVCLGTAIGLVAAAPLEAARFGGQLTDLLRGTSAEAALPGVGTREAASAELLAQVALVLGLGAGAVGWMVRTLLRSTFLVPLGAPHPGAAPALALAAVVGGILTTGLALAAPVAGLALVLDAVVGFAARGASAPALGELATPARILGGAGVLWLALGLVADRLLATISASSEAVLALVERFR